MPLNLNDLNRFAYNRAEQAYLREPELHEPHCACCGCVRSSSTELYLYQDEPWCYDCLEYEGLQPDDIDDLSIYDPEVV